jgi:peptidylprolyl isomerase
MQRHEIDERRAREWADAQRVQGARSEHLCVALDIVVGRVPNETSGRLVVELFEHLCPQACANFRALVLGETIVAGRRLDYAGTPCFRIIPKVAAFFGEFDGASISSTGAAVLDENFAIPHGQRGIISMVSRGPHTIGSAFRVTFGKTPQFDFTDVVVGRVVEGIEFLDVIEAVPLSAAQVPATPVLITFSCALNGPSPRLPQSH